MKMLNGTSTRNLFDFLDDIWYSVNTVMGHNLRVKKAGDVLTVRDNIIVGVHHEAP